MDDAKREELKAKMRVKLPGLKKNVGAGDVVHKITAALGMEHCSECERRKIALNRLLQFQAEQRTKEKPRA